MMSENNSHLIQEKSKPLYLGIGQNFDLSFFPVSKNLNKYALKSVDKKQNFLMIGDLFNG